MLQRGAAFEQGFAKLNMAVEIHSQMELNRSEFLWLWRLLPTSIAYDGSMQSALC